MLRYGYLGVGLGGVGWGNDVHVNLHTHVMLRYGYLGVGLGGAMTFMSTCTHTSCYVIVMFSCTCTHTHVMLRYGDLLLHLLTHVMLRYGYLGVGWSGVGLTERLYSQKLSKTVVSWSQQKRTP